MKGLEIVKAFIRKMAQGHHFTTKILIIIVEDLTRPTSQTEARRKMIDILNRITIKAETSSRKGSHARNKPITKSSGKTPPHTMTKTSPELQGPILTTIPDNKNSTDMSNKGISGVEKTRET